MHIDDGTGSGKKAKVSAENRLLTQSVSESLQHHISREEQQAYQVIGSATIANATTPVLHIKNTSSSLWLVVTYIRCTTVDAAGGTALPSDATRWQLALNRTHASGGSAVTPVNINTGSSNPANVTVYDSGPTLAGTAAVIDDEPIEAEGKLAKWNKDGSVIVSPSGTIEISLVSDHTSGTARARMSFLMVDPAEF